MCIAMYIKEVTLFYFSFFFYYYSVLSLSIKETMPGSSPHCDISRQATHLWVRPSQGTTSSIGAI